MRTVTSYLGIGSNLGDRRVNIENSIRYLRATPRINVKRISRLYETHACGGPKDQPKYLNAAAKINTTLTPTDLLKELKSIELKLGRKSAVRWGPRIVDIDILFYGDLVLVSKNLTIPHPLLHKRIFVLMPLSAIAPKSVHPVYKKNIKELLKRIKKSCA